MSSRRTSGCTGCCAGIRRRWINRSGHTLDTEAVIAQRLKTAQVVYGIPPELALSCGILLWLVTFMSCIPMGLTLAHREHLSLRKLSKASHEEEAKDEDDLRASS